MSDSKCTDKTTYSCNKCGAEYDTEDAAHTCYDSHLEPTKVEYTAYDAGIKYPSELTLTFSDNKQIIYKYTRIVNP